MQSQAPKVEFDTIGHTGAVAVTSKLTLYNKNSFFRGENYAVAFVWNELYILPYKRFLVPFLRRLGVKDNGFIIKKMFIGPELFLKKTQTINQKVKPDIVIESDKNVIIFEFKNFYKSGQFQQEQLPREYVVGQTLAKENPIYLILVTDDENPLVKIEKQGRQNPFDYISKHSKPYLKREGAELRSWFNKNFSEDKIIVISWKAFRRKLYQQLGASKKRAKNRDLEEIYNRVFKRIKEFVEWRKHLHHQSKS